MRTYPTPLFDELEDLPPELQEKILFWLECENSQELQNSIDKHKECFSPQLYRKIKRAVELGEV